MRAGRIGVIPWLLIVAPLAFPPVHAFAQGHRSTPRDDAAAPSSKYADACTQGNARYASRDFQGAITYYQGAIELDPKNPLGHYLVGEAYLAAGNVAGAEAAWN
ncbi:MAG TPA: tetratricopeptide repeat protein, partial [Polyangiaceae bacterium]|nr:tetratricopeptide repeat protein [Polyangiaceae bacterium]